jgi:hypothetical protein
MAHWMKPPGNSSEGYDADNKLAPGSLWRVRVPLKSTRSVALWGGDGLKVRSNNPGVVLNEPTGEVKELAPSGDLRIFELFGASEGGSFIDVWGSDGAFWIRLQALVAAVAMASKAGKAVFTSMDECGLAALDEILSRSISKGAEFAGLIYKQGARFGFTTPARGEPDSALPMLIVPTAGNPADIQAAIRRAIDDAKRLVPAGADPVGTYHAHGNKQGSGEIFSPQDRGFHNLRHWFAYLGTPSRAILRFTPKDRPPEESPGLAAFGGKAEKLR